MTTELFMHVLYSVFEYLRVDTDIRVVVCSSIVVCSSGVVVSVVVCSSISSGSIGNGIVGSIVLMYQRSKCSCQQSLVTMYTSSVQVAVVGHR